MNPLKLQKPLTFGEPSPVPERSVAVEAKKLAHMKKSEIARPLLLVSSDSCEWIDDPQYQLMPERPQLFE
jgi:hypothetical protein